MVVAPSGADKSSLLRAGLLSALMALPSFFIGNPWGTLAALVLPRTEVRRRPRG